MNIRKNNNEAAFANLAQKMVEPRHSHGLSFGLLLITPFLDCLLVRFVICGVLISLLLPRVQGEDATSNVHLFPGNGSACGHKGSIKYYQVIHILLGHFVSSYRQVYDIYPYGASMHFCWWTKPIKTISRPQQISTQCQPPPNSQYSSSSSPQWPIPQVMAWSHQILRVQMYVSAVASALLQHFPGHCYCCDLKNLVGFHRFHHFHHLHAEEPENAFAGM